MGPGLTPATIGLPPHRLSEVFPFHLAADAGLRLLQAGPALSRACPELARGADLREAFTLEQPRVDFSAPALAGVPQHLVVLRARSCGMLLRGQMLSLDDASGGVLFLGSPWVADASDLPRFGLTLGDFALHDPALDLLQLLQAQEGALAELRELTARLEAGQRELRAANEALEARNADLVMERALTRALLDAAPDAIITTDDRGVIETANRAAEQMFGFGQGELAGRPVEVLMPSRAGGTHRSRMARYADTGRSDVVGRGREVEGVHRDGRRIPLLLSLGEASAGGRRRFTAVLHDISDQKASEAALVAAREEALASSRAKSRFLANMSHEIRTPLAAVVGMAELLIDDGLPPGQRESLEVIRRSADALLSIVDDILDLAKIESGRLEIEQRPYDLRALIQEAVGFVAAPAAGKRLTLDVQVDDAVPATPVGDGPRVRQMLLNLLSNAVKFTSSGGVSVTASVDAGREPAALHLRVSDTGVGMSAETLARVFEPFVQADSSTSRRFGGTGLGLPISRHLAQAMGGRLWAESVPGRGSTFHISVPLGGAAPETAPAPPLRILLADDDPVNRAVAARMLERLGHTVILAQDGAAAVAAAGTDHDVVLLDLRMPGLDGVEAARRIRDASPRTRILALTAEAGPRERAACRRAGMEAVLVKPLRLADLRSALAGPGLSQA